MARCRLASEEIIAGVLNDATWLNDQGKFVMTSELPFHGSLETVVNVVVPASNLRWGDSGRLYVRRVITTV